ncbi:uncharacterized protein VP01_983g6 [Puccinia sorghi]|uniref:Uncharacterized protein n=1 Tax=Puccinia sorghi TaxID=27349 RepID=A0A0L6U658_9BASI|nr:uncharacterized protein VP01_983g6 [Puccinia sorghi]
MEGVVECVVCSKKKKKKKKKLRFDKNRMKRNNNQQKAGLAIAHEQPRSTTSSSSRREKIDLESVPQEQLLKKLASLFERLTQRNDRLNLSRSTPATPSTILLPRRPARRGIAQQNNTELLPPKPRPAQSPIVCHFQRLSHPRYPTLDQPDSQLSTSIINTTTTTTTNNINLNTKQQQLSSAARELLSNPSSILTFHAKVVPQISIEAYLLRILKYCPTSNGVFLSSLIYLDRLCRFYHHQSSSSDELSTLNHHQSYLKNKNRWIHPISSSPSDLRFHFVIDSWNLLSDVFYTNSRYAKVGGLPLEELEELEVKFLLMSDFRLMISATEFDEYTERLLGRRRSRTTFTSSLSSSEPSCSLSSSWSSSGEESEELEEESDSDSTDREEDIVARPQAAVCSPPDPQDFLPPTSYASSVSSCNSSERSSCSTITPHSPPSTTLPSPPSPTTTPSSAPSPPLPTTPRSSFLMPTSPSL